MENFQWPACMTSECIKKSPDAFGKIILFFMTPPAWPAGGTERLDCPYNMP